MANIVPKLNLNKTPSIVENNSIIFAKNIRADIDGTIHQDYGVMPMSMIDNRQKNAIDYIITYETLLNRIIADLSSDIANSEGDLKNFYNSVSTILIATRNNNNSFVIRGQIADSNAFYLFLEANTNNTTTYHYIIKYNELTNKFSVCNCNWHWSGGKIDGYVIKNLVGETILCIGEGDSIVHNEHILVPFKCINLNKSSYTDDESIYTQTPNIPISNFYKYSDFNYVIPNGVYQFFIRYKIRDNFYTNWFPASQELFVGNRNDTTTSFGSIKYINTHRDSDNSFTLSVEHLYNKYFKLYKGFQIGFILSHDDEIVARAWKHFNFTDNIINFDYDARDAYEIDVTDLTSINYQIYNVGNVTSFKNKLYISNYTETDFNDPNLQTIANNIKIDIKTSTPSTSYGEYPVSMLDVAGKSVIAGLIIDSSTKFFGGSDGIFKELTELKETSSNVSFKDSVLKVLNNAEDDDDIIVVKKYHVSLSSRTEAIGTIKSEISNGAEYKQDDLTSYINDATSFDNWTEESRSCTFTFHDTITNVAVGNDYIAKISEKTNAQITDEVIHKLINPSRYLNDKCIFINDSGVQDNFKNITISRKLTKHYTVTITNDDIPEGSAVRPDERIQEIEIDHVASYQQKIGVGFYGDASQYNKVDDLTSVGKSSLVPYQKYKFYVHYIKQNGEITNGYYCGGEEAGIKEAPYAANANGIIFPVFSKLSLPTGYVALFFSIQHYETLSSSICGLATTSVKHEGICFDINTGLIPGYKNLHIVQADSNVNVHNGKYYYSSDSSNNRYFGAEGLVTTDNNVDLDISKLAYLLNDYSASENVSISLTKCTPFINPNALTTVAKSYHSADRMNLLGFICRVAILNRERTTKFYTDGSSAFFKNCDINGDDNNGVNFSLIELKNHFGDANTADERVHSFGLTYSSYTNIYSNYNLNCLALSEDPKDLFKTTYPGKSEDTATNASGSGTILLRVFSSLILSSMYELPSMYKNYTKKQFYPYSSTAKIKYDNTIKSSELKGDEESIDIFRFNPNDYYNIPTNRGTITNLLSVGDAILVHTRDSLFKFSGSNNLQSFEGEVQTNESQPFDTGIAEIFGSDFGFAGLADKSQSIVTENGYIFYDSDAKVIYMYSGQGQVNKISDSIEKLFNFKDAKSVAFANDYYNNRFFVCIGFSVPKIIGDYVMYNTSYATLSYNFSENVKSFISLHDFAFVESFNTKTNCYFVKNKNIYSINRHLKNQYFDLAINKDTLYPGIYNPNVSVDVKVYDNLNAPSYQILSNHYDSIIDIIYNDNYESIKTLNAINWCSGEILESFEEVKYDIEAYPSHVTTLKMAEDIISTLPCKAIRVYTDSCITPLNTFHFRSNDFSINNTNSYKYPRFNNGFWTFNYFRNIQLVGDPFDYLGVIDGKLKYDDGRRRQPQIADYLSDDNSLVIGKYIVTRFIFDNEFKLETLQLNYSYNK